MNRHFCLPLFFSLTRLFYSSRPHSFISCRFCATGPPQYYRNWSLSVSRLSGIKRRARAYLEIKHGTRPHRRRYFVYERNYLQVYEEHTRAPYIGCLGAGKHLLLVSRTVVLKLRDRTTWKRRVRIKIYTLKPICEGVSLCLADEKSRAAACG